MIWMIDDDDDVKKGEEKEGWEREKKIEVGGKELKVNGWNAQGE